METPSFELPQTSAFGIPFNANHLKFNSEIDKYRFQKLGVEKRFIKSIQGLLSEYVDKHTLFFLKGTGNNSRIEFYKNKISYIKNLNAGIAEWECPNDGQTVANYNFNETTGITSKDETGVYPLSDGGVPTRNVSGKVLSSAINLDGVDDYLFNNTLLQTMPANGTVETWYKPNISKPDATYHRLWDRGTPAAATNEMQATIYNDGSMHLSLFPNSATVYEAITSQTVWTAGTWYHIACLWGAGGMKNYVNGILDGINAQEGSMASGTSGKFTVGVAWDTTSWENNGVFDLVRVSNIRREQFGGIAPGVMI